MSKSGRGLNQVIFFQQTHNVMVHTLIGDVTWQLIQVIRNVAVGQVVEEALCRLIAALARCQEEGRFLLERYTRSQC